jgi:hypothetical protein
MIRWARCSWALLLLVASSGCGRGLPETAPVTGRVTLGGQPVPGGAIQFWPKSGRPARGAIQPDGTYTLTTFDDKDGAVLGQHVVTIEATRVEGPVPPIKSTEDEIAYYSRPGAKPLVEPKIERLVPERYGRRETSGLSAEVRRGGNQLDFNLEGGKPAARVP